MLIPVLISLLWIEVTLSTSDKIQKTAHVIAFNQLFSTTLEKDEARLFYLLDSEQLLHPLSVTVTPCSMPIRWSLFHRSKPGIVDEAEIKNTSKAGVPNTYTGSEMHIFRKAAAHPGLYLICIHALEGSTGIQIFASRDPGGPHNLSLLQDPSLKLVPLRRRQLSVKWEPSVVNPHSMKYCVVVSSERPYTKLCEAELRNSTEFLNNTKIECVDQKTHLVVKKLEKGKRYSVSLFATNTKNNFTVPYGKGTVLLEPRVQPITLRDGVKSSVSLRKHQGRANFRFRVAQSNKQVYLYVLSCGGAIDVNLMCRRRILESRKNVNGYTRFLIDHPTKGDYYSLKVTADGDQLSRIRSVEALGTQNLNRFPLPELPENPEVHEYASLKKCNSVTVGWVTPPLKEARYCVRARRNPSHSQRSLPSETVDQCLDVRPRRSSYSLCHVIRDVREKGVTAQTITDLAIGASYSIQVTVQKLNGRTLSYKLLNVFTKNSCE